MIKHLKIYIFIFITVFYFSINCAVSLEVKKIDLDDAIQLSLSNNLDLQSARIEVELAKNGVCIATVSNTIRHYIDEGIDSVIKLKRSVNSDNAKRKVDGRTEAKLIEIACGPVPEGHSRWTLRLLEEKARVELDVPVSKDTIGRTLKKTNFDLTATATGVSRQKKTQNL